jgi:sialate O-acetylesterase
VCWFTYRDLYTALAFSGDVVPQGLVSSNWGGTPIQHWSSPEAIAKCSSLKNLSDSVLWNAMLHPYTVGPMSFRTAIWYQGESNVGEAAYYACQFPAMIEDWRAKLSGLNTFGFVQIAGWTGYSNTCSVPISRVLLRINLSFRYATGDLRQAQLQPLHLMPNIALSTAIDLVLALPNPHHPLSAANHAS